MPVVTDDQVRTQLSKTSWCKFFSTGQCNKGEACSFAHDTDELRSVPDLKKTSLCKAWRNGKCSHPASSCQFAHGVQDLRVTPMFVENGRAPRKRVGRQHKIIECASSAQRGPGATTQALVSSNTPMSGGGFSTPTKRSQLLDVAAQKSLPCSAVSPRSSWERVFNGDQVSLLQLCQALISEQAQNPTVSVALERMLLDAMPDYYED
jgi:hypothetical protein